MLQGLPEPINDLSRGALVHDIAYKIALTAIQAEKEPRCESADRARLLHQPKGIKQLLSIVIEPPHHRPHPQRIA
jgi:hypothetical protein